GGTYSSLMADAPVWEGVAASRHPSTHLRQRAPMRKLYRNAGRGLDYDGRRPPGSPLLPRLLSSVVCGSQIRVPAMSDADLETFRSDARAWLEANFPAGLKGKAALAMSEVRSNDPLLVQWRKAVGAKGWATPTWPREYGGGGLSAAEARVLQQEMGRAGA